MYPNNYYLPPPFSSDFDFFHTLRGYVRFSIALLFFVALILALLWNLQPWFEIDIKPANKSNASLKLPTSDRMLQSDVEIITVRPGDTLSEIAERYGVGITSLLEYNMLENPNTLRAGQQLKIPKRLHR
jgi:hypothetical protein